MDFPQILFNNPFRVLDLYAEASLEQIKLQGRRIKTAIVGSGSYESEKGFDSLPIELPKPPVENPGKNDSKTKNQQSSASSSNSVQTQNQTNSDSPTSETDSENKYQRTPEDIDRAVKMLHDPDTRILCRLFWFTGASALDRRGVRMLSESGLEEALAVWKEIYDSAIKKTSPQQLSFLKGAYQNASVALMMFGKISEAVSLIESAPFKWVDFDEISDKYNGESTSAEYTANSEIIGNDGNGGNSGKSESKDNAYSSEKNSINDKNNNNNPLSKQNQDESKTDELTDTAKKPSAKGGIAVDSTYIPVEKTITYTRKELLQKWYATILESGNIAFNLGNLGAYGEALQKASEQAYPLTLNRLNDILVGYASVPKTMAYVVEAIKKMMPIIVDLRYLQVIPQKNYFAPYLTSQTIDTFLSDIDSKVFDYVIKGPTEIKDTDAITMEKFRESLLQCVVALDIVGDFVPEKKGYSETKDEKEGGEQNAEAPNDISNNNVSNNIVSNNIVISGIVPSESTSSSDSADSQNYSPTSQSGNRAKYISAQSTSSAPSETHPSSDLTSNSTFESTQGQSSQNTEASKTSTSEPYKGNNRARMLKRKPIEVVRTPYEGLQHLRSIISPFVEILYNLYSNNLTKLIKQPQRVLSTTTQKKHTLEFGAQLLLAKYASVWYEYKFYCDCYPQGRSYQASLEKFTEGFYQEISKAETVTPWQSYLLMFPQSEHISEVIEKVNTIRGHIAREEVNKQQRQKAQTFSSVKVLIAYYSQNPEACTNEEIWSRRAMELAKSKSDYRQISHVFGTNQYGRESSEQYRSILKKEQFKVSQAIILVVLSAFLGLIVFKVSELGMLVLGFGINFNAEIIGVAIAIILFIAIRIYLKRKSRDSGKNATFGFFVSFIIGLFSCVALWNLVPGLEESEDGINVIQDTIHDYFNPPTHEDGEYQEDKSDRV